MIRLTLQYQIISQQLEANPGNMQKYQEKVTRTNRELKFLENIEKELELLRQRRRELGLMHDGKSASKNDKNSEIFTSKQKKYRNQNDANGDSLGQTLTSQKTMSKYGSLPLINNPSHNRNLSGALSGPSNPKPNFGSFHNSFSKKPTDYNNKPGQIPIPNNNNIFKAPDFTNVDYADDF